MWRALLQFLVTLAFCPHTLGNPDAKRLYDDLMSNYNRLVRPVRNNTDKLTVKMGLKLSQLIDVNLKNQIMTTNVWVQQEWTDDKLRWDPAEYGGVLELYVPAEQIWLPDIVLYNNADGNCEVTIMTKAMIHEDGRVIWNPPAIYKSSCVIDVEYFPFDKQDCQMKFGSWTYDGDQVDLKHINQDPGNDTVPVGIDLTDFYLSVEWDIIGVPAKRKLRQYACCPEVYPDVTFKIVLRRKILFYTVNLIIPCVAISFLSILVFYLPSDSGEKVSLSISIMLSLTFFLLVLSEIIPPTSLAVPLLGKYLVFTMILLSVSVVVAIAILNVNFRSPSTHTMSPWIRKFFIGILPRLLLMRPPQYRLEVETEERKPEPRNNNGIDVHNIAPPPPPPPPVYRLPNNPSHTFFEKSIHQNATSGLPPAPPPPMLNRESILPAAEELLQINELDQSPRTALPQELGRTIYHAMFIAQHIDNSDDFNSIREDWKYVAMVLDRLFLFLFTISGCVGTCAILLQAPSLYDRTEPIDVKYSQVAKRLRMFHMMLDDAPFPEALI